MFHSYRRFNQSSKKRVIYFLLIPIVLILWGVIAYKGVKVNPKIVTENIDITN